jgi:hypothetical protein
LAKSSNPLRRCQRGEAADVSRLLATEERVVTVDGDLLVMGLARALAAAQPRIALRIEEAAAALGVSADFFNAHVRPELRLIRRGRLVLVAVTELEAWAERSGARTLEQG